MHSFKTTVLSGAVLLALSGGVAHAQSAADLKKEIEELRKQVEELKALVKPATPAAGTETADNNIDEATRDSLTPATQADIKGVRADLENYKYDQQRARDTKTALTNRGTTITGTLTAKVSQQQPSVAPVGATATSPSSATDTKRSWGFDAPGATLAFNGSLFKDYTEGKNLTYAFSANAVSGALNVLNANLAYSFFSTNSGQEEPKLTLTLGQQQLPFGLEAQTTEEIRPVITSAQFLSRGASATQTPYNGGASFTNLNSRQVGLILRGDAFVNVDYTSNYRSSLIEYALGVVNGTGVNVGDNNTAKDWIGRVAFTVPADYNSWLRELKFGFSHYTGKTNIANTPSTGAVVLKNGDMSRSGFDINYTRFPYSVAYEYAEGRDEIVDNAATATRANFTTSVKKARGQYVTLAYTWGEQFLNSSKQLGKYDDYWPKSYQAFVRYDIFDADTANNAALRATSVGDKSQITTFGLNAFFAETTKFQLNYLIAANDSPATGHTLQRPRRTRGLVAQFQYGF
ncbi:MAG: DUF3138 domain-containing protein [Rubrivivax sp.]|nr:MAG: DUF3138 domain-containing protein [Rubrivivax sp.]